MYPTVLLLVEDEPAIQEVLGTELSDAGYDVVVADDGEHAVAELDAGAGRFKALITDIKLSAEGRDGWDVSRHARQLVANVPVVYITGDSEADWRTKGVPDSLIMTKPFAAAQLVVAISTLIEAAEGTDPR
jgi:DNA-binding response OmpR family regulator